MPFRQFFRRPLSFEQLDSRELLAVSPLASGDSSSEESTIGSPTLIPLASSVNVGPLVGSAVTIQSLQNFSISGSTGEKPQSKVWSYGGSWWSVMPDSSGTWVRRLDGTTWTSVLKISSQTKVQADVKAIGDVTHILLYTGTASSLVSVEYVSGSPGRYQLWSQRPSASSVTLTSGVETASIEVDSRGVMWLASDASTTIEARYSIYPYVSWSAPVTVATGTSSDDIAEIVALPTGEIGILWSNQKTKLFGFRRHVDGTNPSSWTADEKPGASSALSVGAGMADDHISAAVASDGTLYVAVKTSYDKSGYPSIGLLVHRPSGAWEQLYTVDTSGTRPIVVLNEAAGRLLVIYTKATGGGDIVYRDSSMSTISFGSRQTLLSGAWNDASSTRDGFFDQLVVLASKSSTAGSTLITVPALAEIVGDPDPPSAPTNRAPLVSAGTDQLVGVNANVRLKGTASDDGLPNGSLSTSWSLVSGPTAVSIADATALDTTVPLAELGTYVFRLTADDGELTASDDVIVTVAAAGPAQTVSFQDGAGPTTSYKGTRDTSIRSEVASTNYGLVNELKIDASPDRAALLKWDTGYIPTESVVQAASISLYVTNSSPLSYQIYEMLRDWQETQATWKVLAKGTNWQAAGAAGSLDRGATVLADLTGVAKGAITIQLNAAGIALVQQWVNNPANNYGIVIQNYDAGEDGLGVASREASQSQRPKLTVTYTTPLGPTAV